MNYTCSQCKTDLNESCFKTKKNGEKNKTCEKCCFIRKKSASKKTDSHKTDGKMDSSIVSVNEKNKKSKNQNGQKSDRKTDSQKTEEKTDSQKTEEKTDSQKTEKKTDSQKTEEKTDSCEKGYFDNADVSSSDREYSSGHEYTPEQTARRIRKACKKLDEEESKNITYVNHIIFIKVHRKKKTCCSCNTKTFECWTCKGCSRLYCIDCIDTDVKIYYTEEGICKKICKYCDHWLINTYAQNE